MVFSRLAPSTFAEDEAIMHFDWLNHTAGEPDDTWVDADFSNVEGNVVFWWETLKSFCSTRYTFKEIRWYRVGTGVTPPNPPVRIHPVASAGTSATAPLPPQCASSISLHTAPRRNWGRTYLPGLTTAVMDVDGALTTSVVTALATAAGTLYNNCAALDLEMVVMSKTRAAALSVEAIAVDDIVDVVRRRRWDSPGFRSTQPAAATQPASGKFEKAEEPANSDVPEHDALDYAGSGG